MASVTTLFAEAQVKKTVPNKPIAGSTSSASKAQDTKASTVAGGRNIAITLFLWNQLKNIMTR